MCTCAKRIDVISNLKPNVGQCELNIRKRTFFFFFIFSDVISVDICRIFLLGKKRLDQKNYISAN